MSKEANYFKIGLFTLAVFIILTVFLIILGIGNLFTKNLYAETYFNESVKGLNVGSAVKYRGVTVGEVEEIDIASDIYGNEYLANDATDAKSTNNNTRQSERYIYVRFALYPRLGNNKRSATAKQAIQNYIDQGLRVSLATQDLVGNVYLELNFSKPGRNSKLPINWKPKNLYIPSAKSTLSRFTDSIDRVFTELDQINFKKTVQDFDDFTITATDMLKEANMKNLSADFSNTLKKISTLTDTINQLLTSKDSKHLVESLNEDSKLLKKALTDTSDAMNELNALASRANQLTASQQNTLVDTLNALKQMSLNLETATETLKNNPSSIVFGQPAQPVDPSK